jgi:hypothetical protein
MTNDAGRKPEGALERWWARARAIEERNDGPFSTLATTSTFSSCASTPRA